MATSRRACALKRTIIDALERESASEVAIACARSGTSATRGELASRARAFARALEDLGYMDDHTRALGVVAKNSIEHFVAVLGCALAGVSVRYGKEAKEFASGEPLARGIACDASQIKHAGSIVGAHEPIAFGRGVGLRDDAIMFAVIEAAYRGQDVERGATERQSAFYFSRSLVVDGEALLAMANRAAHAMELTKNDSVCVAAPLGHSFGFAYGALAALARGSRVVLATTEDGEGEGERAHAALRARAIEAIRNEKCALVVCDSHVAGAADAGEDVFAGASSAFRGGLVKIGSGDAIGRLGDGARFLGVDLLPVGMRKK